MLAPQFLLPIARELIVDLFAGGGGASTGIEMAVGRHVDVAVDHDAEAISLHQANHPQTRHFCSDVFEVDPVTVTDGMPVGLLWASPDCKHFSKAKGGKPVSKKIRSLAWVVIKWAKLVRPRVICLENVEEFQTWGPLADDDRPCPMRKGDTFRAWKQHLQELGYTVEHRELRGCDYGAPTIRKRLFLVARCDGQPIVWPTSTPTHAQPDKAGKVPAGLQPWRTAADCIDWSIPAPSIFERKKPLADATCRRIAKGVIRYVVDAAVPFIVPQQRRQNGAVTVPTLIQTGYGERPGQAPRVPGLKKPLSTATTVDHHSLVAANLVHMGHGEGKCGTKRFSHGIRDAQQPLNTVTAQGAAAALVTSHMVKLRGDNVGAATTEPVHTVSAQGLHHGEVRAFLTKYYGTDGNPEMLEPLHTVTTKDRFGLVTIKGEVYAIVDIGLRMLAPRELYRAQGFPESYAIDRGAAGEHITKTAQVRMCGNSVCPPLARALVSCNYTEMADMPAAMAA